MPLEAAQSSMAVQMAPDWDTRARSPGRAVPRLKVAFRPMAGRCTPRQLGPTKRMPCRLATAITCSSSAAPLGPVSRKPAVSTTAWRTPRLPHSSRIVGTLGAGVAMMARSGVTGSSPAEG